MTYVANYTNTNPNVPWVIFFTVKGTAVSIEVGKDGNVLFNDAHNTFYLRLYGIGHMVKYYSDSERQPAAATWATLYD